MEANANRPQGPNVKKLAIHKMTLDAVPPGGGLASAINFLTTPGRIQSSAKDAVAWVFEAIDVVKSAPDNTFGNDDEAIAAEILRRIDERKKNRSP